jgi:hypothetical protein
MTSASQPLTENIGASFKTYMRMLMLATGRGSRRSITLLASRSEETGQSTFFNHNSRR